MVKILLRSARRQVAWLIAQRGYEVHRHPAARRQQFLKSASIDLVLDVGAARGAYAMQLRQFGYRDRIISFEPMRVPFAALERATASDAKWLAVQCALGNETGETMINVAGNSDSSSLLPMLAIHKIAAPHANYVGTESVRLARLDDLCEDILGGSHRPFLKVDAQGYEREILLGASDALLRLAGIQLELSFVPLYEGSLVASEAIRLASDYGFTLVDIEPEFRHKETGQLLAANGVFLRAD